MTETEILQEANLLLDRHKTMSDIRRSGKAYMEQYGKETYFAIFRAAQGLHRERALEEKSEPSAYTSRELTYMTAVLACYCKAPRQYSQTAGELKGRYKSMEGILANCFPHQVNGRPARKSKNLETGLYEWHAYKVLSFETIEKLYLTCVKSYYQTGGHPEVTIHSDGELV